MDRSFYLSSLDGVPVTYEHDFSYSGISGYAEVIGCKIVFFRKNRNDFLDALSFIEISPDEYDFCNNILEKIGFSLRFGDSLEKIRENFGAENSVDTFFDGYDRYNYFMGENLFMSFCIGNYGLNGLEIIFSPEIIDKISGFR